MLPIYDKPTLQYIVEEAIVLGITDILIVTGRNKRFIEDNFDNHTNLNTSYKEPAKTMTLKKSGK